MAMSAFGKVDTKIGREEPRAPQTPSGEAPLVTPLARAGRVTDEPSTAAGISKKQRPADNKQKTKQNGTVHDNKSLVSSCGFLVLSLLLAIYIHRPILMSVRDGVCSHALPISLLYFPLPFEIRQSRSRSFFSKTHTSSRGA